MTETLINSLSQIPNLNVKARSTVFRYKGKEFDLKKIAAELKEFRKNNPIKMRPGEDAVSLIRAVRDEE